MPLLKIQDIASGSNSTSASTLVLTVASGHDTAAGTSFVLRALSSSRSVASVADSKGNTYVVPVTSGTGADAVFTSLAYSHMTTALVAGDTITITYTGSATTRIALLEEWPPLENYDPALTSAQPITNGTALTVPGLVIPDNREALIVAAWGLQASVGAQTFTAGTDYTASTEIGVTGTGANRTLEGVSRVVSSSGTYTPTGTLSTTRNYTGVAMVFAAQETPTEGDPTTGGVAGWNFSAIVGGGTKYWPTTGTSGRIRWSGPHYVRDAASDIVRTLTQAHVQADGISTAQTGRLLLATNDHSSGVDVRGTLLAASPEMTIEAGTGNATVDSAAMSVVLAAGIEWVWIGWWQNTTGTGYLQVDDYLGSGGTYLDTVTYSSSGTPTLPATPTFSGTRGLLIGWFDYSVTAIPDPLPSQTRATPGVIDPSIVVAVPNAGPSEWSGSNWQVPLLPESGQPRTLHRTGVRIELSQLYRYVSGDVNAKSSYVLDLSSIATAVSQASAAGLTVSLRVRMFRGPDSSNATAVPRFIWGPKDSSGACRYGFWNSAGGFIPDVNHAFVQDTYFEAVSAVAAAYDGIIHSVDGVGMGQFGEDWFGGVDYGFTGGTAEKPGNIRVPAVVRPTAAYHEAWYRRGLALWSQTRVDPYVNVIGEGASKEVGYNLLRDFPNFADQGDFFGEYAEWDGWTDVDRRYLSLQRRRLHRFPRGGEPSQFLKDTDGGYGYEAAWKVVHYLRIARMGNGNQNYSGITTTAQKALAKATYLKMGYRIYVAYLDYPTTIEQGALQAWTLWLRNPNVTAAMDPWAVYLRIRAAGGGQIYWSSPALPIDLQELKPTGLRPRRYDLNLTVTGVPEDAAVDIELYATNPKWDNLRFANTERTGTGAYVLASPTIESPPPDVVTPYYGDLAVVTMEDGRLTGSDLAWDEITQNTVALDDTRQLKGRYSAIWNNTTQGSARVTIAPVADLYIQFYLKVAQTITQAFRLVQLSNDGVTQLELHTTTGGGLQLKRFGAGTIGSASAALVPGTIYRVGLRQQVGSGANGVLAFYLAEGDTPFGAALGTTATDTNTLATTSQRLSVGFTASGATVPLTFWIDSVRLDSRGMPQEPRGRRRKRILASGTNTQLQGDVA